MQLRSLSVGIQAEDQTTPQKVRTYVEQLARSPKDLQISEGQPTPHEYGYAFQPLDLPEGKRLTATIMRDMRSDASTVMFRLRMTNDRYNDRELAAFTVQQESRSFDLSHRYVDPAHRKNGYGSLMLDACEQYVAATDTRILQVNLGQRHLLQWLLKRGYASAEADAVLQDVEAGALLVNADDYIYLPNAPSDEFEWNDSDWVQRVIVQKKLG